MDWFRVATLGTVLVTIVVELVLYLNAERLAGSHGGRIAVMLGLLALPLIALLGGGSHALTRSSSTEFCLSCHEMANHGKSLFVDDRSVLPAAHYQNRLIERDRVCYACHTDYAMFGDLKAKVNGLKHVWVHYVGDSPPPAEIELYEPYPNRNCLHCHTDARSYLEASAHQGQFEAIESNERSCLKCHAGGHALSAVREGEFWGAD